MIISLIPKSIQIIILLLLYHATSLAETQFDFRNTRWGMTKEEVKASEPERLLKEVKLDEKEIVSYGFNEVIIYVGKTAATNVQILYSFQNNHLIHAVYLLVEQYEDKTLYIAAFDRLRETLTQKYGLPIIDDVTWLDNKYKRYWGSALEFGDLYLHTSWESTRTKIDLCLSKNIDANIVNLMVIYGSRNLVHIEYF